MVDVFIGLGSNLGNPARQLTMAVKELARLPQTRVKAVSGYYRSDPTGPSGQPDYVNAVAWLLTSLKPLALLRRLRMIEKRHGRVHKRRHWGPRTLDLDLLLYGQHEFHHARLVIPHYALKDRDFVLIPLAEIAPPGLSIPGTGPLETLLNRFNISQLQRLRHV